MQDSRKKENLTTHNSEDQGIRPHLNTESIEKVGKMLKLEFKFHLFQL